MQATLSLEFGDLADVTAGKPKAAAPPASRERSRKPLRETRGLFINQLTKLTVD
jgi:hypothetical protein